MTEQPFEHMRSADGLCEWYFSYSNSDVTTGVLIMQPGAVPEPHRRDRAFENNVQLSGECTVVLCEEDGAQKAVLLKPGAQLRMKRGQLHTHRNNSDNVSVTLFKHDGNILEIMAETRKMFQTIPVVETGA